MRLVRCEVAVVGGAPEGSVVAATLDALNSSSGVPSVMANLVAGTQSAGTTKRRLLAMMEFGLAPKWLRSAYLPA